MPPTRAEPGAGPEPCAEADARAIAAVVDQQLAAFAAGDFAGALEVATTGFQDSFTAEEFQELIETQFPVVGRNTGREFGMCLILTTRTGPESTLDLTVTAEDGTIQALRYLLERETGDWRIGGAVPIQATV